MKKPDSLSRPRLTVALSAVVLVCCTFLFLPFSVSGFNWLDKGKELLGGASTETTSGVVALSEGEIGAGLKDALRVGTERVVGQLGSVDGFQADPQIHIPLPESLKKARSALAAIGQAAVFDDLELKLNRAAEQATPLAKDLFWTSIEELTLEDVNKIYNGPDDAATQYFRGKMSTPLTDAMTPVVENSMSEVGVVQAYDLAVGEYSKLPFVPDLKADLTTHVVGKGLDGIFFYLAKEEAAIRQDPVKRTTQILQKVFGR